MDLVLTEWLSMLVRWLHVIAGIADQHGLVPHTKARPGLGRSRHAHFASPSAPASFSASSKETGSVSGCRAR